MIDWKELPWKKVVDEDLTDYYTQYHSWGAIYVTRSPFDMYNYTIIVRDEYMSYYSNEFDDLKALVDDMTIHLGEIYAFYR